MKKINFLILLAVAFVGISCEPTYTKEYNWAYPVAGDWTVNLYVDGEYDSGPYEIKSYNSSFGQDSIWIDDYDGNFWDFKAKVAVDMTTKTFTNGADSVVNAIPGYEIGVIVSNGKIIDKDSIFFEIKFQDDSTPYATTYQLAGHRTTSYEEYMGH